MIDTADHRRIPFSFIHIVLGMFLLLGMPLVVSAHPVVQPLVIDHVLEPRGQAASTIMLRNPTNVMMRVYASVNAVRVDADGGIEEFTPASASDNRTTITSWIEVTRARIEIPPGGTYEVPVQIRLHPQAEPGVYHALIGFASGRNQSTAHEHVRAGRAPGTILRIEVAEHRTSFLQLERFMIDRFVTRSDESQFEYTIVNPSDTPLIPQGQLILYNTRGDEVGSLRINQENTEIAPGDSHVFRAELPETRQLGRHRAFLSLTYGEGQRASLTDTVFFYHIPLATLLVLFAIVLLFSLLFSWWLHRRYAGDEPDDHDPVHVFVRDGNSRDPSDHDINLKIIHHDTQDR